MITQLATARIGAILVTINPAYKTAELRYALDKAGVSLLVMARGFRATEGESAQGGRAQRSHLHPLGRAAGPSRRSRLDAASTSATLQRLPVAAADLPRP